MSPKIEENKYTPPAVKENAVTTVAPTVDAGETKEKKATLPPVQQSAPVIVAQKEESQKVRLLEGKDFEGNVLFTMPIPENWSDVSIETMQHGKNLEGLWWRLQVTCKGTRIDFLDVGAIEMVDRKEEAYVTDPETLRFCELLGYDDKRIFLLALNGDPSDAALHSEERLEIEKEVRTEFREAAKQLVIVK